MNASSATASRPIASVLQLWNAELAESRGEALALVLIAPLLLLPAIWNRFPFIYYDTGAYLFEGLTGRFVPSGLQANPNLPRCSLAPHCFPGAIC